MTNRNENTRWMISLALGIKWVVGWNLKEWGLMRWWVTSYELRVTTYLDVSCMLVCCTYLPILVPALRILYVSFTYIIHSYVVLMYLHTTPYWICIWPSDRTGPKKFTVRWSGKMLFFSDRNPSISTLESVSVVCTTLHTDPPAWRAAGVWCALCMSSLHAPHADDARCQMSYLLPNCQLTH
jgi:hypothetical protein